MGSYLQYTKDKKTNNVMKLIENFSKDIKSAIIRLYQIEEYTKKTH